MLPPVPATPVAHAMQANQRQASTRQVEQAAPVPDDTTQVAASPVVAGARSSMELLDLSGQMRLAQSLSVFAETLGSLLKLPRRDGEALADYSKRLAAAINALSATERTRLQAQLNQIMQGATLRLLAELLKDPSGPAAARLAVQIEIAQYQEQHQGRDLAARHVVSSYRQNNGNDFPSLPANANARTATADAPDNAGAEIFGNKSDITSALPDNADGSLPGAAPKDGASQAKAAIDAIAKAAMAAAEPAAASDISRSGQAASESSEDATSHLAPETATGTDGDATQANQPAANNRFADVDKTLAIATEARHQQQRGEPAPSPTPSDPKTLAPSRQEPKPATIYDAAALARLAHEESSRPVTTSTATTTIARVIVDGFQADWIADLLAGEAEAKNANPHVPTQSKPVLDPANEEPGTPMNGASPTARQALTSAQSHDDVQALVIGPLPPPATAPATLASIAAQPDSAFEKALLGMTVLPREVPGHPLVPQNAKTEFDDDQDHEIRRKSPVGDDEQPSQREHQGFHQPSGDREQQPDGDEQAAEHLVSGDEAEQFEEPDNTQATAGPKQVPRRHLSDHPAPSAEDFYRRMAALE
jgi:hypothetical protein